MGSQEQLTLREFVEANSAQSFRNWRFIEVEEQYPFARALDDLESGKLSPPEELPYANPKAARDALQKSALLRQIWGEACAEVRSGRWECHARREDHIKLEIIPWQPLLRAVPDFEAGSISILGQVYEDVNFTRLQRDGPDEKAIKLIRVFCSENDPRESRVEDIREAIRADLGLVVTDGRVRKLMREAGVDLAWSSPGRKPAKKAKPKP